MKTIMLITALLCGAHFSVHAKSPETVLPVAEVTPPVSFSFIRGHKQGKNHAINWGMDLHENTGISHFVVVCTYEDPNDIYSVWRTVGMIPATARTPIFKIIDTPVLPGTLSYRVIAVLSDNSTITSDLYIIYIQ